MMKTALFVIFMFVAVESATVLQRPSGSSMRTPQTERKVEIAINKCVEYYVPVVVDSLTSQYDKTYELEYKSLCRTIRSDPTKDVEKRSELDEFKRQDPCFNPNSQECILVNTLHKARENELNLMRAEAEIAHLKAGTWGRWF